MVFTLLGCSLIKQWKPDNYISYLLSYQNAWKLSITTALGKDWNDVVMVYFISISFFPLVGWRLQPTRWESSMSMDTRLQKRQERRLYLWNSPGFGRKQPWNLDIVAIKRRLVLMCVVHRVPRPFQISRTWLGVGTLLSLPFSAFAYQLSISISTHYCSFDLPLLGSLVLFFFFFNGVHG